jgi:superkiller protein 3
MNGLAKSVVCGALLACVTVACGRAEAQAVGTSRRRIVQDPEAATLNQLLADAQKALDAKDYATAAKDYQDYLAKKPDDAAIHFQLGYTYTALRQSSDAAQEYQKAIDLNPKMAEAYLNLGLTLAQTDPAAAIAPLTKAVELKPDQIEANFALGVAYERTRKLPEAEQGYAAAVRVDPKNFDAHASLARVLLAEKKAPEAEAEFRAALAIQPDSAAEHLGLAQTLTLEKKPDEAAEELKKYGALHPNDPGAAAAQASLLADAGKDDEALAALDAAAAATNGKETSQALKLRAAILFRKKDYAALVPALQKLIALEPKNPDYPAELGHALLEKKDYAGAVDELIVALTMNPKSDDVLKDLILSEYLAKNYPAALHGLDDLAKREELPLGSWFVRATCYDRLGQKPEALAAYQKFLSMNKDENSDMYFEASARARILTREIKEKRR